MSAEEVNAFAAGHVDRLTAAEAGQRPPPVATITETPMSAQQWADQERITADPTLGHIEKINQLKALELQAKLPAAREAVVDAMLNNKKVLIFTLLEESGATSAHAQMRKSLKQEPRLVERYGAGVGQAVDDALGLHTGQSPMNERDVTLQRFRQVGVRDGRAPMNAMFATYGTFKESTTAFDPKQLAQRYTVVALGLPWDKATLDQAVARLDRVGNRVGVDLLVPITSAPESATSKLTLSQAIYYGYVAPKEGIANAALGDAPRDAKATPKRLLADLTRLTPDQLGMFLESGKLSPQELAAYLTSDRGADYYGVNARVRIHTALHHDIATQIARQAAGSNTVLIDLGGGDGALGARLKKLGPHLSSMTVDVLPQGHPLIQDKSRHLSADIGQPLRSKVENRLQSLGQSSAPRVVVWNMSLLGFKSGQQSSLAERLKIGADLLRAGETAYIGDVNSIVKALPKGELQNAAEQAGLKIEKVRLLERDDAGIPGVVFRFTKR